MVMSRAEYEALASAINEADVPKGYRVTIALEIATALCATNDRFDPVRFMEQADLNVSAEEISGYSHALYLRTKTGVGATRNQIRSNG
jgi:cytosine/adenosine deaminase-related metal-dependent hydrolase